MGNRWAHEGAEKESRRQVRRERRRANQELTQKMGEVNQELLDSSEAEQVN